jgi:hypothetical protein
MGFATILCLFFIVLKISGIVTWPWLYVFSPLIINMILYIISFVYFVFDYRKKRKW